MSQSTSRVYSFLERPRVYEFFQSFVARKEARRVIVDEYIRPRPGNRIVDVGCGPGTMLPYLGPVDYTGFDLNAAYIEHAKQNYSGRGTFFQARVGDVADQLGSGIDIVIAIAVLHHLGDQEARALFAAANRILRPGGRLITFDPVFISPQNPIARLLIRLDRGKGVRTASGYLSLAKERFGEVEVNIRTDLLRMPYTHCIMISHKDTSEDGLFA
jgi:SAM-dependent methyltransferase